MTTASESLRGIVEAGGYVSFSDDSIHASWPVWPSDEISYSAPMPGTASGIDQVLADIVLRINESIAASEREREDVARETEQWAETPWFGDRHLAEWEQWFSWRGEDVRGFVLEIV